MPYRKSLLLYNENLLKISTDTFPSYLHISQILKNTNKIKYPIIKSIESANSRNNGNKHNSNNSNKNMIGTFSNSTNQILLFLLNSIKWVTCLDECFSSIFTGILHYLPDTSWMLIEVFWDIVYGVLDYYPAVLLGCVAFDHLHVHWFWDFY